MQCCSRESARQKHCKICIKIKGLTINQNARKWNNLRFKNWKSPFTILLLITPNFEAITETICSENKDDNESYMAKYQKHAAGGYECNMVCWLDDNCSKLKKIYRNEDTAITLTELRKTKC